MLKTAFDNSPLRSRSSEEGVTSVEYCMMLVLIAIAVAAFGAGINGSVTSVFTEMTLALATST